MFQLNKRLRSKSVEIVGDGDDVELIGCFETAFGLTFLDEEVKSIVTLGDAYQLICSKLPKDPKQQVKCLTAMAYYRLNKAICERGKMDTTTRVEIPKGRSPKSFQKHLEDRSGLRLDFLTKAGPLSVALFLLQFVTWIAAPIIFSGFAAILVGLCLVVVSYSLRRIADSLDDRIWIFDGTLGDLSRQASEANIGKLILLGGKWAETDVWKTMTSIISDFTGFSTKDMTPETTFL